jgi:4-diphosphocytidyl-2-C-methyl-D-erythritol kinase
MLTGLAHAKLNLALVVGPRRADGMHEVVTLVDQLELADTVGVERAEVLRVDGYPEDTLVREALRAIAERTGMRPGFAATIEKRIPVAAGLGGGSSDAATALVLANEQLPSALGAAELHALAATLGADVPLFLHGGPVLATGEGTTVVPMSLPRDYHVVLWLPEGEAKRSTAAVYAEFDDRGGEEGFGARRSSLLEAIERIDTAADLTLLPPNDLVRSAAAHALLELGAFRADVTGAGPTLYGLFHDRDQAVDAAASLGARGQAWVTAPSDHG